MVRTRIVWRYRGATVDIDHLKTVVERPDLVERIDAQVTCDRLTEDRAIAIPANER